MLTRVPLRPQAGGLGAYPVELAGGVNLYGFAAGDPVNLADPFGLFTCDRSHPERCTLTDVGRNFVAGLGAIGSGDLVDKGPGWKTGVALGQIGLMFGVRAPVGQTARAATVAAAAAVDVSDILMPGGSPVGSAGSRTSIRELSGGVNEATALFNQLTRGATPISGSSYPGTLMRLPNGGTVGLRTVMSRSPGTAATVEVNVQGIPIDKIKFNP